MNIVLIVVATAMAITPRIQERVTSSGLLQPSILAIYTAFQVFSAISAEPVSYAIHCNSMINVDSATGTVPSTSTSEAAKWFGIIFAFLAIVIAPMGLGGSSDNIDWRPTDEEDDLGHKEKNTDDEESEETVYSYSFFHFIMICAIMYGALTITGWTDLESAKHVDVGRGFEVNFGWTSVYVKMASTWVAFFLFFWVLLVPLCFPDRDFPHTVR